MKKKRSGGSIAVLTIIGVLLASASFFVFTALNTSKNRNEADAAKLSTEISIPQDTEQQTVSSTPKIDTVESINAVLPSVVGISVNPIDQDAVFEQDKTKTGVGSGVIVSESGYIVTNRHIVDRTVKNIHVSLSDSRVILGDVVWSDSILDIAIIKAEERNLKPAALGDAKLCRVGQEVFAIGNPLSLQFQRTVTNGIISAIDRTLNSKGANGETILMEDLIQTDTEINICNSGGPLVNQTGEVIGINTDKLSDTEGNGFAIPINIVKPIVKALEDTGEFKAPYFGIFAYDRAVADYLTQNFGNKSGIYVVKVDNGSPAYNVGIRAQDTITHVNHVEINTMMDFRSEVYAWNSDSPISVTYITNGVVKEADVRMERK